MQYRKLGKSGIDASAVGLGAWAIGGWAWGGTDEKLAVDGIRAGIDAGITLIDTAPVYGMGRSEEIVGKAIAGNRDKVVLATKCGLVWHTDKGTQFFEQSGKMVYRYLGKDSIAYEVEQSLKRLNVDYIDLMQTHWQDATTPIEETMSALLKLKEQGKIKAIGVSNATTEQMDEYRAVGQLDTDQELYNMIDRQMEEKSLPYCIDNNIAVLSYSSLGLGILSGKITPDRKFKGDDQRAAHPRYTVENRQKVANMLAEFEPIAENRGLSMAQLVIAWTIAQPGITHALCGVRNPEQALENAKAGNTALSAQELEAMDQIIAKHASGIV